MPSEDCKVGLPDEIVEDIRVECGAIVVPQSRRAPGSAEIELDYMRLVGAGAPDAAPLFLLAGGPGQAIITATQMLLFQQDLLGSVLADRDIVLLEQRGTFNTRPHLACPGYHAAFGDGLRAGLNRTDIEAMEIDRLSACRARHEATGAEFAAYTSVENAADVNDARRALGYDRFIYYGASYGTILGQLVMRDFAEYLEAVILDGADVLTEQSWIENRARDAQWGQDNLARLCAADAKCAETYDVPVLFDAAMALFDEGPIPLRIPDQDDPSVSYDWQATEEDLAVTLYRLQTDRYGTPSLPALLTLIVEGGRDELRALLADDIATRAFAEAETEEAMTTLMHAAMVCSDDPARDAAELRTDRAGRFARAFGEIVTRQYIGFCMALDLPQLSAAYDAPATADVPTLILSGGLDVQTPLFLGNELAESLPNASHVIFPAGHHVQLANLNSCAIALMKSFIDDPGSSLDLSCVGVEAPQSFLMPGDLGDPG